MTSIITSHVRSTKDVNELVFHVKSWPRAAHRWTRGTARDDTNAAREHHNMTGLWRAGHCDNRLPNGFGETPHRTRKTPRIKNQRSRVCAPRLILVQPLNVSSDVARSCTIRESTKQDRARQEHPRTVSAHHNEHEEAEVNEQGAQSNARRHSTTQKNVQRRNDTYSQEDEDSQFRCCLFQAIVKSSCLGILWQSRFAHDLQVSRSVSSAEHGSRQLSWRTCGLTRRTKNHGTSLGEATGAFRRNTVYHVTSSTKSDGVSEPVCFVQMHRLGKNK